MSSDVQFLERNRDLPPLAYVKKGGSKQPTIVFCNGYGQDMGNPLGLALERFLCDEGGYSFIRFDYTDTGYSVFAMAKSDNGWKLMNAADDEVTRKEIIDDLLPSSLAATYKNCPDKMKANDPRQWSFYAWRRDTLTVLRRLLKPDEKAVLIGHDIGVWLAILAAIRRPDLVHSIVCLSSNVDCFVRIFADELNAEQQGRIRLGEIAVVSHLYNSPVPLAMKLIDESKPYHLFSMKAPLPVKCPVRFFHLLKDKIAPYDWIIRLTNRLETQDVQIFSTLHGTHNLLEWKNLDAIYKLIAILLTDNNLKIIGKDLIKQSTMDLPKGRRQKIRKPKITNRINVSESEESSGSESDSGSRPKALSKELYAEIYRYPIRKQTYNNPPKNKKKWDFIVKQEIEDIKRLREENELMKNYGERCTKMKGIVEAEKSCLSVFDEEEGIQFINQQAPLAPIRFSRHLSDAKGLRLPSERPAIVYVGPWRSTSADRLHHFCASRSLELIRNAAVAVLQEISAKSILLIGQVSAVLPPTTDRRVVAVAATADKYDSCSPLSLEKVSINDVIFRVCLALNDPDSTKNIRMLEQVTGSNVRIVLRKNMSDEAAITVCALQEALRALE